VPEFRSDPLSQELLVRVLGAARVKRLVRAGWLSPVEQTGCSVLFDRLAVHAALKRMERERCPADRIESLRVTESVAKHGRTYVPKGRAVKPFNFEGFKLDFSGF
jgi:hypothetical protein